MPRVVTFIVADELSIQSEPAIVTINFQSIDNPPVLDLNGPQRAGRDSSVTFQEESDPIMVRQRDGKNNFVFSILIESTFTTMLYSYTVEPLYLDSPY